MIKSPSIYQKKKPYILGFFSEYCNDMVLITLFLGRATFNGYSVEMRLHIFKNYLKLLFFIFSVRLSNIKRCDFEINLAILVLIIFIVHIIGNMGFLGNCTANFTLRFLGDGNKKVDNEYYWILYQTTWNILILALYKIHWNSPIIAKLGHFPAYLLNSPRILIALVSIIIDGV